MPEAAARLPFCVGAAVGTTVAAEVVASTGAGTVPGADAGATSGAASISGAYGLAAVSSGVGADTMGSGLMGPAGSTIVPLSAVVGLPVDEVELTPCDTNTGIGITWTPDAHEAWSAGRVTRGKPMPGGS